MQATALRLIKYNLLGIFLTCLITDLLSTQELLYLRLFPHTERALLLLGRPFLGVRIGVLGATVKIHASFVAAIDSKVASFSIIVSS